jgi:hypothetical protein
MRSLHRCTSPPSYGSMFKRCSHKFLLPCPSRILLELPPMYDLCQSISAPPLVKQHLFTSWRILSSNPILLNQGNKDYSSSSTSAIKILVSARLHCRRCYGATYRISSSENGILLHIRESEFEHSDRKSHHQATSSHFLP